MIKSRNFTFFLCSVTSEKKPDEKSWLVEVACGAFFISTISELKLQVFMSLSAQSFYSEKISSLIGIVFQKEEEKN